MRTEADREAALLIGRRIKAARALAGGMSQTRLGELVGLSQDAISGRERGDPPVSGPELARIADATEQRVEWFVQDLSNSDRGLYLNPAERARSNGPASFPLQPDSLTA